MDIADLLILAPQMGASDLHLTVDAPPSLRVHGHIAPIEGAQILTRETIRTMIYDVLTDQQKARFEEHHELDFAIEMANVGRFRVNAFVTRNGEGAVFRTIPTRIRSFAELGLPEIVRTLSRCEKGLVLVTGPTGSGKSTTLATMVDMINEERSDHILTIEDPIEFVHAHKGCIVNQREVGPHTDSFSTALRSALREDPDIILVGEMRDLETIGMAITAAETGHLVFGTLHTMGAPQTVDRVIDVFPTDQQAQIRAQFAEAIRGVISQTLVPTKDGKGRAVALEIMIATPAIRNLIREGKTFQMHSVIETSTRDGMCTLDQSLKNLVVSGKVTKEDALRKAFDADSFEMSDGASAPQNDPFTFGSNGAAAQQQNGGTPGQSKQPTWGKPINY